MTGVTAVGASAPTEPYSCLEHLECSRCGETMDAEELVGVCRCGGPLLARYDEGRAGRTLAAEAVAARDASLWRYHEMLPVREPSSVASLGEGMTPLVPLRRLGEAVGLPRLYLKDEGRLPTGTFKARGAAVGVSRAKELGATRLAIPTNGNAGSAWATYAARAGIECLVLMPPDAQAICRVETAAAGARLGVLAGTLADASAIVQARGKDGGWFDVSTMREPYRVEGKKTMGYEVLEQTGWRGPDVVVYPTGGGVGLIGLHKAFEECRALGLVRRREPPRLVSVQSEACAPVVRAFEAGEVTTTPWSAPGRTAAFGLCVPKPYADDLILRAIRETSGCALAVSEEEIHEAQRELAASEGVLACPEGAATIAALRHLRADGRVRPDESVVVINTGTGLKYPETFAVEAAPIALDDEAGLSALFR